MPKSATGTREWSETSENIQVGCEHDCRYCYARAQALQYETISNAEAWKTPRPKKQIPKSFKLRQGTIMFPTTHDITELNLRACVVHLRKMLAAGNKVLIVSKPHLPCIQTLCTELAQYKSQVLFRFTIGTRKNDILKFWEPNAPRYEERLDCLKTAFQRGFQTSVSAEPFLDADIVDLVYETTPYITDCIWIGLMNKIEARVDGSDKVPEVVAEVDRLSKLYDPAWIMNLYSFFKNNPKVKWKESIKKIVGLKLATEIGLDE